MRLKGFSVNMYRSIIDSNPISVEPLTVLLGKNESGKTSLLKALYKLNPVSEEKYSLESEWPRSRRGEMDSSQNVCIAEFELSDDEIISFKSEFNLEYSSVEKFEVSRDYRGYLAIWINGSQDIAGAKKEIEELIRNAIIPYSNIIDSSYVGTIETIIRRAYSFSDLEKFVQPFINKLIHTEADEITVKLFSDLRIELTNLFTQIKAIKLKNVRIREYFAELLPKFIYIDEYSIFRGRANLLEVLNRKKSNSLTPLDNTVLTIMDLAGLDLEKEVTKITSGKVSQRQFDLEDAGNTLTNSVKNRWNQRDIKIIFRADGPEFLTYIQDNIDSGLTDLEERSRGFQWFFSFDLTFMKETKGSFKNCVLLLDEPGLYLHPDAQRDMIKNLEEYSKSNTIVYTTHLPFMIDLQHPERLRVMNESEQGAFVLSRGQKWRGAA